MNTAGRPQQPPMVGQRVPKELVSSALFLLKRLGMKAKEQSFGAYEEAGLHPYHHAILAVLDEGSQETQGAIADALGYDKGQLVGLLDELEDGGLTSAPAGSRRSDAFRPRAPPTAPGTCRLVSVRTGNRRRPGRSLLPRTRRSRNRARRRNPAAHVAQPARAARSRRHGPRLRR